SATDIPIVVGKQLNQEVDSCVDQHLGSPWLESRTDDFVAAFIKGSFIGHVAQRAVTGLFIDYGPLKGGMHLDRQAVLDKGIAWVTNQGNLISQRDCLNLTGKESVLKLTLVDSPPGSNNIPEGRPVLRGNLFHYLSGLTNLLVGHFKDWKLYRSVPCPYRSAFQRL